MSTGLVSAQRHALGLPAGSIRAVHVGGIVSIVCLLMLFSPQTQEAALAIPPYLVILLLLTVVHFFSAHGNSISTRNDPEPSPWYLPGGTVRLFVILALVGCIGWLLLFRPSDGLRFQFERSFDEFKKMWWLPLLLFSCYLIGVMVRTVIGQTKPSPGLQDFEAWISLIALLAIAVAGIIHLVVNPSLEQKLYLPTWESGVGSVIAFYFGERS